MIERRSAALVLALALGCGSDEEPVEPVGPVTRIVVTPDSIAEVVGREVEFSAHALDAEGREVSDARFEWNWEQLFAEPLPRGRLIDRGGGRFLLDSPGDAVVWAEAEGLADTARLHMAAEGEVKWAVRLDWFWTLGGPALAPDGETLYVLTQVEPSQVSRLWAVRAADGATLWSVLLDGAASTYPMVGSDGTIYVVGERVFALTPDGSPRWTLDIPTAASAVLRGGAISDDGTLYAAVGDELLALDILSRDTLWSGPTSASGGWLVPPTLDPVGDRLYASWAEGPLHAFDAGTGELLWSRADTFMVTNPGTDSRHFGHGPVVADGRVHWPIAQYLETLTPGNEVLWLSDNRGCCGAEPILRQDGVLLSQNGQGLEPRDPATGEAIWFDIGPQQGIGWGAAPALASDGALYLRTPGPNKEVFPEQAGLFAMDAAIPEEVRWAYPTNQSRPEGSPPDWTGGMMGAPLIGPDGTVYTYNADTLFAFWENAPLADTPWPMWRGDTRRSGVVRE